LKWPLRRYLLERSQYGTPLPADRASKYGFSLRNRPKQQLVELLRRTWQERRLDGRSQAPPLPYPFDIGVRCSAAAGLIASA
jgi:hypothetical protein